MPALISSGRDLDSTSDAVDDGELPHALRWHATHSSQVNVLKGKLWNEEADVDPTKDKSEFRQYETACDRVKAFYREQHGAFVPRSRHTQLTDVPPPLIQRNRQ